MITSLRARLFVALLLLCAVPAAGEAKETLRLAYLSRADDPAYERHRLYTGLVLRDRHRPVAGARLAVKDSRVIGRALGLDFELVERELAPEADAAAAIAALAEEAAVGIFLLDLPLEELTAASRALADQDLILFNIRHPDDALRGADCSPLLFHSLPSRAMLTDAWAQHLRHKGWTDLLVLAGPEPEDAALVAALETSARKFGLRILAIRPFVLSNDPRQRDRTNVAMLTGAADYDVIFLADAHGEFGRYLPYQSYLPRPVIGSEGLIASAWHWTWERHGAPQLNQRFDRLAKRPMAAEDWAAWAAVKAVVEAASRSRATATATLRDALTAPDLRLDAYKGAPASFRPWDRQLRQAIFLHSHNAVIAQAPVEGFEHATNTLDTLGPDARESACAPTGGAARAP